MALSAKLQIRQSQSLVMTPQLLQSIRLLQYSTTELQAFVDTQMECNPLLVQGAGPEGEPSRSVAAPAAGPEAGTAAPPRAFPVRSDDLDEKDLLKLSKPEPLLNGHGMPPDRKRLKSGSGRGESRFAVPKNKKSRSSHSARG